MKKTELMERYEDETGKPSIYAIYDEWLCDTVECETTGYITWLEKKVEELEAKIRQYEMLHAERKEKE